MKIEVEPSSGKPDPRNPRVDDEAGEGVQERFRRATSQSIDWYAEGQARTVEVGGIRIAIRLVGRKGRRARIAITAPAGSIFR
jgi:hypothetical protein